MRATLMWLLAIVMLFFLQVARATPHAMVIPWFITEHSSVSALEFFNGAIGLPVHEQPTKSISPVVQVAAFQGNQLQRTGSGFILHLDGRALTNSHLIHNASAAEACQDIPTSSSADRVILLVTENGENNPAVPRYLANIVRDLPKLDLALLQISARIENDFNDLDDLTNKIDELKVTPLKPEEVAAELERKLTSRRLLVPWDARTLQRDQSITLRGFPALRSRLSPTLDVRPATLSNINELTGLLFADPSSEVGMSGGPVIDRKTGLVVGILCGIQGGQTVARSINSASALLREAQINRAPVARFSWQPMKPKPGEVITFDACAFLSQCADQGSFDPDGQIIKFEWAFDVNGDGNNEATLSGQKVTFTFSDQQIARDRDPLVTLTVTDEGGFTVSSTKPVSLARAALCKVRIQGRPEAGEFTSLQSAISNVREGEIILVDEGICQENVRITKSLTLLGVGAARTTLLGDGSNDVITIDGTKQVTVQALTIRGGRKGIRVLDSTGVILEDNVLERNQREGLDVRSSELAVQNNRIVENEGAGASLTDASASFKFNTFVGNKDKGLVLRSKSKATLTDDGFESNIGAGVFVTGGSMLSKLGALKEGTQAKGTKRDPNGDFGHGIVVEDGSKATIASGRISGNAGAGIFVTEATGQTTLVEIKERTVISENSFGLSVGGSAQASLTDSTLSGNILGLFVGGTAKASLNNSRVTDSKGQGIFVRDAGMIEIQNSQVSNNGVDGFFVRDSAAATLTHTQVIGNGFRGLMAGDSASVRVEGSTVEDNGKASLCARAGSFCDGIELSKKSQMTISNTMIKNNADWGVAAMLKRCGYDEDKFEGRVVFQDGNLIESNNKLGHRNGMGNPGNHPFKNLPDGQVCVP
ncbi:right-handed parallel beta-helix repeat-containing protein [Candidatus Acetothermia bacterium]|nr:right-handed parallel beta-helix repeat-containing protein [Candidatus Acetothermia bacterium]